MDRISWGRNPVWQCTEAFHCHHIVDERTTLDCQQFISASFIFVTHAASRQRASSNWSWHLPNMKATNHTFLLGLISGLAPLQTSAQSRMFALILADWLLVPPKHLPRLTEQTQMAEQLRRRWHWRLLGGFNMVVRTCAAHVANMGWEQETLQPTGRDEEQIWHHGFFSCSSLKIHSTEFLFDITLFFLHTNEDYKR